MCLEKLRVVPIVGYNQWEELFLENLINQQMFEQRILFGGNMSVSEILELSKANFNLSRFWLANLQLSLVVKLSSNDDRITALIGMADMALASEQYGYASFCYAASTELIKRQDHIDSALLNYCNSQIKLLDEKKDELKIEFTKKFQTISEGKGKHMVLFENYEVFDIKMSLYSFFMSNVFEHKRDRYKYLLCVLERWNKYKETSSIVLSGIVTKGDLDLEKAMDATFEFIASFPLKLLVVKLLAYTSIETILNENLDKFDNSIFSSEPTMEEIVTKAEKFQKDQNYLRFVSTYLKSKVIINVKKFCLVNSDKTFLIYEIDIVARLCMLLIELFKPEIEPKLLNKRLFDKRKKFINLYQKELEPFLDSVIKIGMVSLVYLFLVYKDDEDLATYTANNEIRLMKLKVFKKSVFMFRSFYTLFKVRKLNLANKNIIKKLMIFSDEILAHLDIEEILPEQLYEKNDIKLRRLNNFFTERLLSGYITLLELNPSDDPRNTDIIKHIMYYVLLQGGYHISVIWFLNTLRDYSELKDTITVINREDGYDEFETSLFAKCIAPYTAELDYIIQKIVLAQKVTEILKFKSYENDKEVIIEKTQSTLLKAGYQLVLPQVIMNADNEIIFLPEFSSFIQDGNTVRMNLMNALSDSKSNKINPGCYVQLKSILKPSKEDLHECIRKSNILVENLLNSGRIPLVNEVKQRKHSRMLIEDACCGLVSSYIGECEQVRLYRDVSNEALLYQYEHDGPRTLHIVENIKDCGQESVENKDFIGFSTILDVYLNDWNKYNIEERITLMELLYEILDENKEMLAEISWDLPPLLLPFIDCEWPVRFSLRESVQVSLFWKVFNLLSEYGNPKELLLTCCELLGDLKDPDLSSDIEESDIAKAEISMDDWYKVQYDDLDLLVANHLSIRPTQRIVVKFHALFQCIKFCVQRIKTIYPSKYLSMIISSVLNFFSSAKTISGGIPVQRSLYLFIRDYIPPDIPDDIITSSEVSEEDLNKIFDDENYLQQKLMRLLFDSLIDQLIKNHYNGFVGKLLPKLKTIELVNASYYYELVNRLLSLSLSLDINISNSFEKEIKFASMLFDNNIDKINTSEDILRLIINSYNSTSFRSKGPEILPISTSSIGFLYIYAKYIENWQIQLPESITVLDLIKCQLKLFIPYIVNSELIDFTTLSYFMVLTIVNIEQSKQIVSKDDIKDKKTKLIIVTYLQNISSIICKSDVEIVSKLFSRFLLKFLQHLPEEESYSYILDTLNNCPFDENVISTLKIFKNLITVSKFDDEKLTADLSKLSISANSSSEIIIPPTLPDRNKYSKTGFINFTKSRQNDFLVLIYKLIDSTFDLTEKHKISLLNSNRLLSYLNFINTVEFEETDKILDILDKLEKSIKIVESTIDNETEQGIIIVVDLIKFSVSKIRKIYLKN
ncbi:hypothetical protein C6P42_000111 [Pichia californica]|nr:hypothetical protein C6P42_000111 [[Candida] californica]